MDWTRETAIAWCRQHPQHPVRLTAPENPELPDLQGRLEEVLELDLCGSILTETELTLEAPLASGHTQAYLTFHSSFLGIQLLHASGTPEAQSFELPYPHLELALL